MLCTRRRLERDPDSILQHVITDDKVIVPERYKYEHKLVDEVNRHFSRLSTLELKTYGNLSSFALEVSLT